MNKVFEDIEWHIETNKIYEIQSKENEKSLSKTKDWKFPDLNLMTTSKWNIVSKCWTLSSNVYEFKKIYTEMPVLEVFQLYTYYLLSNFKGVYVGK